jgi:septum formation protein
MIFPSHKLILASQSPRRQMLLREMGFEFEIRNKQVEEDFDASLQAQDIPLYLCKHKANAFLAELVPEELLITADTIVWIKGRVLNKPAGRAEAYAMLELLSGNMHEVYTAVCLASTTKMDTFYSCTKVYFKILSPEEINYYIDTCKPYDKAGSYGAQEWMGYVGIERIEGSYFNVMGLPTKELYEHLMEF